MQGKQTEGLGPTASLLVDIINQRAKVIALPLLALILGFGATYIVDKTYTARASLLPPAQSNAGVSTLASLGALASFAGSSLRAPQEQYASLMMSDTVIDRVIRKFDLQKAYDRDTLTETRIDFRKNVAVSLSKKDSIITVEVDDTVPKRAADVANELIAELKSDVPVLALVAADETITAIAAGASGALHRDSPASAISAALLALTEGLAVFDRSFVSSLVPKDRAPEPVSEAPLPPAETLTERERQVLTLLAEGLSNKEIAAHLEISDHTAKFHVNSILQKLSAQKRVEAVVRAARLGLIEL